MKAPCRRCGKEHEKNTVYNYLCDDCWNESHDLLSRAIWLVVNNRIKETGDNWYEIRSKSGKFYRVKYDSAQVNCECKSYVIDGVTKGWICSHIQGVIIFEAIRRMTLKGKL